MVKPRPDSIELAQSLMDAGNPLLEYLAILVGRVMQLNYSGVRDILDDCRAEFEERGVDDLLESLEDKFDELFMSFINEEGEEEEEEEGEEE